MATLPVNVVLISLIIKSEKITHRIITGIILCVKGLTSHESINTNRLLQPSYRPVKIAPIFSKKQGCTPL